MRLCVCVCLQAIETFAVTVKEIAQLLQGFGSELSESELPDEPNAIEFLLHSHTHRYRQMKVVPLSIFFLPFFLSPYLCEDSLYDCFAFCAGVVWFYDFIVILLLFFLFQDDIRSVLKEGRLLLSNLETVKASKRDIEEETDIQADMDTVQRYSMFFHIFNLL